MAKGELMDYFMYTVMAFLNIEIFIAQILPSIRKYTKYIRELGIHADDAIKVIKEPLMPLLLNQSVE